MTKKIQSINPYTEVVNAEFSLLTREELSVKIDTAYQAFLQWRQAPNEMRKNLMLRLADVIAEHQELIAHTETQEMGMLYRYSFA